MLRSSTFPMAQARLAAWASLLLVQTVASASVPERIDFNFDIKPILSDRCYVCHGPDAENRQADLRLDVRESAFRESESGNVAHVIAPGDAAASELLLRIDSPDPDQRMPPPESNLSLTPEEIELVRRWIDQGAEWKEHWSFLPVRKIPLPEGTEAGGAIDAFILQRQKKEGLRPARRAPREQLIRRVTFDLTGLPPTLNEIDAFLADDSPAAYEELVDRLLSSSRFGERMAATWLDAARYSDTYGYQVDRDRYVWPWRDWVIRALNQNLPYDQFITEQLAGDLLPEATQDQIMATTFNRLHPQKVEGGSVPEEFRIEYVADRMQTFATSMLGLTLECARCHDHKYDPFTQEEYYQLTAFFDNIDEAGLYSYFTSSVPTPTMLLYDETNREKTERIEKEIGIQENRLCDVTSMRREDFTVWLDGFPRDPPHPLIRGEVAHLDFEDVEGPNQSVAGVVGRAVKLTGDDGVNLKVGNFHRYDPFSVACWLKVPARRQRAVVFHRSRAWTDAGSRGYELLIEDGRLSASLIHFWPGNAISVRTRDELTTQTWQHVVLTYDGSSRADGIRLYVNGVIAPVQVVRDNLCKNMTGGGHDHITIGERFRDSGLRDGCVDEFQVFDRQLTDAEVAHLHDGNFLESAFATPAGDLTARQKEHLFGYFLAHDAAYGQQLEAVKDARQRRSEIVDGIQEIMVMRDMQRPRQTYLLRRGAYDARQKPVKAATPSVLPAMSTELPANRLALARWLVDKNHPLTSRVAVNRFWQTIFGHGLVRTPEDFGSQGEIPTHPDLLDWLARDFVEHGWDVKRLLKQMVMSETYRQSSEASPELLRRDPENRFLARAPSYRWPAEMLRDQALAVSGLLVDRTGGPPVKPYEIAESFKPDKPDTGAGLYRRSVYTYWKRTGPAPVMMALDAAKRDVCRVRRGRTSSPLQTLVLMNGPQFVEAARFLAVEVTEKRQDDVGGALVDVYRCLTGRRPTDAEMTVLRRLYDGQWRRFNADPVGTREYLDVGQGKLPAKVDKARLAAVAAVANALFALDECMMKR